MSQHIIRVHHNTKIYPIEVTRNFRGTWVFWRNGSEYQFERVEGEWILTKGTLPEKYLYQIITELENLYHATK